MQKIIVIAVLFCISLAFGGEEIVVLKTETGNLEGSLFIPDGENPKVSLIIAGSGPTDRNGNNPMMTNNSLKMLATALAENGIASLRYDKRGIGKSANAGLSESDLRFEHYVQDAKGWIDFLSKDGRFTSAAAPGSTTT